MTGAERRIRVVVVDDDQLMVKGLSLMVEMASQGEITVVGTAHDGSGAVPAVQQFFPDVVLMDIRMPGMDGIAATRAVMALPRPPRVIVLTTLDSEDEPVRAAEAGAAGFLLKTESPEDVVAAVRAVAAGDGALSRRTAKQLLGHIGRDTNASRRQEARALLARLTDKEREVAEAVARGLSNPEIGGELFVSVSTVKAHLAAVQEKLGVENRVLIAVLVTQGS